MKLILSKYVLFQIILKNMGETSISECGLTIATCKRNYVFSSIFCSYYLLLFLCIYRIHRICKITSKIQI